MDDKTYKQIMFDIDTKVAEQIFGTKYRVMYDQIGQFLKKNGFKHIEGSGYISKAKMNDIDLLFIISVCSIIKQFHRSLYCRLKKILG